MSIRASVPWPGPHVGCFDPAAVLHKMEQFFGGDFEYEPSDLFDGHYERRVQTAFELGIPPDSPAVRDAARKIRELSPRYRFRLRDSVGQWFDGQVDRYSINVECADADLADPFRLRVVEFLRSLGLGSIEVQL